jgi:hypothetical protein
VKTIRIVILLAGIAVAIAGATKDWEPLTLMGSLLVVVALLVPVLFRTTKK